jgi:hypothetical protein
MGLKASCFKELACNHGGQREGIPLPVALEIEDRPYHPNENVAVHAVVIGVK